MLRRVELVRRNGQPVTGFGVGAVLGHVDGPPMAAVRGVSPWQFALVTSVVGTATGWLMEEIARRTFRRGRSRRRR